MTVSYKEVANLINQLESIIDESSNGKHDNGIFAMNIVNESGRTFVHLATNDFLSEFIEYNVSTFSGDNFELFAEIFGVKFMALIRPDEILDLREDMPEHFDYISRQVQLEKKEKEGDEVNA